MSDDQEDLNLNELVGNLLAAHNEEELPSQLEQEQVQDLEEIPELSGQAQSGGPELGDDDLAAVVAQAISGIQDKEPADLPSGAQSSQIPQHSPAANYGQDANKEEEWAQILQQDLLQESQLNSQDQIENSLELPGMDNLDHEDEALRRAILESLQNLNVGDTQAPPNTSDETRAQAKTKTKTKTKDKDRVQDKEKDSHRRDKSKSKKSKNKDAKKSDNKKKSKKKKDSSKKRKGSTKSVAPVVRPKPVEDLDLLNFEDVIKGFMDQAANNGDFARPRSDDGNPPDGQQASDSYDAETRALVEATLQAFENELLMGSSATAGKKPKVSRKTSIPTDKSAVSSAEQGEIIKPIVQNLPIGKSFKAGSSDLHKKKTSKKVDHQADVYDEGDFSKALAEMVDQVVNTSLEEAHPNISKLPAESSGSKRIEQVPLSPSNNDISSLTDKSTGDGTNAMIRLSEPVPDTSVGVSKLDDLSRSSPTSHPGETSTQKATVSQNYTRPRESLNVQDKSSSPSFLEVSGDLNKLALDSQNLQSRMSFPDSKQPAVMEGNGVSETLDLNQIMQNAMAMAFQGQLGHQISQSALDDFNQQLQGFNVSQLLEGNEPAKTKKKSSKKKSGGEKKSKSSKSKPFKFKHLVELGFGDAATIKSTKQKTKVAKTRAVKQKDSELRVLDGEQKKTKGNRKKGISSQEFSAALHATGGSFSGFFEELPNVLDIHEPKKPGRPRKSPAPALVTDKYWRKRYKLAAIEAATRARRQRMDRNKAHRKQIKDERHARRQERHLKKEEDRMKEEQDRRELEVIVARGPPYPPFLRLTKKGTPKKPFRRYTADEMKARQDNSPRTSDIIKSHLRRQVHVPVASLRKIPISDFAADFDSETANTRVHNTERSAVPIPLIRVQKLSDITLTETRPSAFYGGQRIIEQNPRERFSGSHKKRRRSSKGDVKTLYKTVVHREKVCLHPPWSVPAHPPLALPAARKKKTSKVKKTPGHSKSTRNQGAATFISGNKIIPASLFPIINTLKTAARAKAAAGATPEEAGKQLGAMLRNARLTIAQTLARARSRHARNYDTMKTMADIKEPSANKDLTKGSKRMPLFSLSSIKAITDEHDAVADSSRDKTSIKVEPGQFEDAVRRIGDPPCNTEMESKQLPVSSDHLSAPSVSADDKVTKSQSAREIKTGNAPQGDGAHRGPTSTLHSSIEANSSENNGAVNRRELKMPASSGRDLSYQDAERPLKKLKSATHVKLESDPVIPPLVRDSEIIHKSSSSEVKDELPPEVQAEITRALKDIIRPYDGHRKKYVKKSTPVLNLDGVVPPKAIAPVDVPASKKEVKKESHPRKTPEILAPRISKSPERKSEVRIKTPGAKVGSAKSVFESKFHFDIPTKNTKGEALPVISILRRAKDHLNVEELTKLKKSMTNERKRKWREANASKNKEHDLRARLRKRANALFGNEDTAAKNKWFDEEYTKRSVKAEVGNNEDVKQPTPELPTSISDHEVLNMIACILEKEDVARAIEREINEEANMVGSDRKAMKRKVKGTVEKPVKIEMNVSPVSGDARVGDTHEIKPKSNNLRSPEVQTDPNVESVEEPAESIDPALAQLGKRARDESAEEEFDGAKRRRNQNTPPENLLLKRPAYINMENI
ncbi:LADA_0G07712g1_1 [Lachancea dasiensis]|uniref:LADA_0G07712g1_1 n=1 Tax=Lachancea dasiensis TaxID=1072105 RepID=A0A1G4JTT0_9SACH|nr:LADA_0G07712g1_1 [Lachancea dasiensis]